MERLSDEALADLRANFASGSAVYTRAEVLAALDDLAARRAAEAAADTGQAPEPQPVALEWRETARELPPVGEWVLGTIVGVEREYRGVAVVRWNPGYAGWGEPGICYGKGHEIVTHWQPLPALPNGNTAPQGEGARDE